MTFGLSIKYRSALKELLVITFFTFLLFSFLVFRRLRFVYTQEDLLDFFLLLLAFLVAVNLYRFTKRKLTAFFKNKNEKGQSLIYLVTFLITFLGVSLVLITGGVTYMSMSLESALKADFIAGGLFFSTVVFLYDRYKHLMSQSAQLSRVFLVSWAVIAVLYLLNIIVSGGTVLQENINLFHLLDVIVWGGGLGLNYVLVTAIDRRLRAKAEESSMKHFFLLLGLGLFATVPLNGLLYESYRLVSFDPVFHSALPRVNFFVLALLMTALIALFFIKSMISRHVAAPIDKSLNFISVPVNNKTILVSHEEIAGFYIKERVTFLLRTDGKKVPIEQSLENLMKNLDSGNFYRINRATVISRAGISSYASQTNRKLIITMKNDHWAEADLSVSRYVAPKFKDWIREQVVPFKDVSVTSQAK